MRTYLSKRSLQTMFMKKVYRVTENLNYIFLIVVAILILLTIFFKDQPGLQFQILVTGAILYVSMALAYHHLDKSLTFEVLLEYILIGSLAIIILLSQLS